jgi:PBP1b-binding outer membrane lipoprotein LpoB
MKGDIIMIKKIILLICLALILVSCASATAKKEEITATYFESVDHQSDSFEIIKIVDKESGCKYMLIESYRAFTITQMMGKDGLPLCK